MKNLKTKFATVLLVVGCAFASVGATNIMFSNAYNAGITANAETAYTEYNVSDLTVHLHSTAGNSNSNNTTLWLFGTGDTSNAWAYYTCESGTGVKLNGEDAGIQIQDFSGGLYLKNFTANVGDVITIGGTFVNEAGTTKYIIPKDYSFQWDGSGWVKYVEYTTVHNLGALKFQQMGGENKHTYLERADGQAVTAPEDDNGGWTATFTKADGVGIILNDNAVSPTLKFPGCVFLEFGSAPNEGDILTIGGTFVSEEYKTKYVIEDSSFTWNGSAWNKNVETPEINYTEYTVSNLQVADTSMAGGAYCANNVLSLTMLGGANVSDWPWFVYESGAGLKVNGETAQLTGNIANAVQDTTGGLYFQFAGVNTGDVVSIGGVFSNADLKIRYVIPETKFTWTGTAWETCEEIEYTSHELGVIEPNTNSSTFGAASARPDHLYTEEIGKMPVQDWESAFVLESGYGVKINGEVLGFFEIKSTDGGLWFGLSGVQANDVVSICGTFKNAKHATKYVIEESKMVWNGSTWEKFVEFTPYDAGVMGILSADSNGTVVYLRKVDDTGLPVDSWDHVFNFRQGSGVGITLNGTALSTRDIKSPGGNIYIGLGVTAEVGDELVVEGTFYSIDFAVEYVVERSSFIYCESGWLSELDKAKLDAKAELDSYKSNFNQEDYYEAEWASFDAILAEGETSIENATTNEELSAIVTAIKAKMDDVVTKEESDAIFNELKQSAKGDLANYKSESDYRADDWATIQTIITNAGAQIDASASVTEINTVVESAKEDIDAVKTSAQRDADDAAVANAKADLAAYKSESDYRADDWAIIQTIIANAGAQIDEVIGNETAIGEIVVSAKEDIDAVKTSAQRDADDAAVANAKADLAAYKSAGDYRDAQWAEIQAIITKANGDIDLAVGDQTAIDAIVTNAKKDVDKVKTSKTVAKDEVREYYGAIDHSLYSDYAEEIISGYMAEVLTAIDNATTNEQIDAAIAEFKEKVEKVEKLNSAGDSSEGEDSGCTGSTGAIGLTAILGLVGVVSLIRRKKEER